MDLSVSMCCMFFLCGIASELFAHASMHGIYFFTYQDGGNFIGWDGSMKWIILNRDFLALVMLIFFFFNHKNIFAYFVVSPLWMVQVAEIIPLGRQGLSYPANTMGADIIGLEGSRASAAMRLILFASRA